MYGDQFHTLAVNLSWPSYAGLTESSNPHWLKALQWGRASSRASTLSFV